MAYLGGKSKSATHILQVLNAPVFDNYDYIEPFCGYCHILRRVEKKRSYTASDNNELLIVLLKHIQTSKKHPHITPEEYTSLRKDPKQSMLRAAYAAFCYSYNGKYFGGYVYKYKNRNYAEERKKYYDTLHANPVIQNTEFHHNDYTAYKNVKNKLIYCDPPYEATTEYHSAFDSTKFWDTMRHLSKNNYVFISEYNAPPDFVCITQKEKYNSLSGKGATRKRMEKVYVHESLVSDPKIQEIMKSNTLHTCKKRQTRRRRHQRDSRKDA